MVYYERDGLKTAIIVFLILFILALGAGAYFFFANNGIIERLSELKSIDYDILTFSSNSTHQIESPGYSVLESSAVSVTKDEYMTPLGFPIESYSEKWQGDKLVEIYEELLKNKHGEEINYISKIVVYGGVSDLGTSDSIVAGAHSTTQEHYQVFFDVPALIPPSLQYGLVSQQSVIELYNMDEYDTISEAARTIAHEYGHHFTIHYFMQDDDAVKESDYFALRSFYDFDRPIFFDNQQDYFENHMWSIYEIATEDYVQIMGSPNTRQTREYMDIYQVLQKEDSEYRVYADSNTANVFPQENMNIPFASNIPGLRDYFYSFIGEENDLEDITDTDFNLSITKRSSNGYTYYDITWDNVYDHPDTLYTLVCYTTDKQTYSPVKTVHGNEKPIAKVGTVSKIKGNSIMTYSNGIADEDRYFRLIVMLPDGRIISSDYYFAEF